MRFFLLATRFLESRFCNGLAGNGCCIAFGDSGPASAPSSSPPVRVFRRPLLRADAFRARISGEPKPHPASPLFLFTDSVSLRLAGALSHQAATRRQCQATFLGFSLRSVAQLRGCARLRAFYGSLAACSGRCAFRRHEPTCRLSRSFERDPNYFLTGRAPRSPLSCAVFCRIRPNSVRLRISRAAAPGLWPREAAVPIQSSGPIACCPAVTIPAARIASRTCTIASASTALGFVSSRVFEPCSAPRAVALEKSLDNSRGLSR